MTDLELGIATLRRLAGGDFGPSGGNPLFGPAWPQAVLDELDRLRDLVNELLTHKPPAVDYQIITTHAGQAIVCTRCGSVSWNANDIAQRYCKKCNIFHKD